MIDSISILLAAAICAGVYISINSGVSLYYKKEDTGIIQSMFCASKAAAVFGGISAAGCAAGYLFQCGRIPMFDLVRALVLMVFLGIIAVTDITEKKIPNKILIIMLVVFVVITAVFLLTDLEMTIYKLMTALFAAVFSFVTFGLTFLISKKMLGAGDVKLSIIMGLYLGSERILGAILYGAVLSALFAIFGIIFKKLKKNDSIPFAPFLLAGTIITLFVII